MPGTSPGMTMQRRLSTIAPWKPDVAMRIRISHTTTYTYDTPPSGVTQLLRLTPRDHEGSTLSLGGSICPKIACASA